MISFTDYKQMLSSQGSNLGDVKRNQSNMIMNATFTRDSSYKRVYILTQNGWKFEDAKYQLHSAQSILKDAVDYYLQFRPKVHYPIGSYVIIPDDTGPDINLTDVELQDPFLQPVKQRTQWWCIVGRTQANDFVRYCVLQCNREFKWVWDGKIQKCFGMMRDANSYTSGIWLADYTATLDDLTNAWMPDLYQTYGDNLEDLGLDDNRTIFHGQRFILSNNIFDPRTYEVTKIKDLVPQGIIKLSLKQDEFNEKRDSVEYGVCDYYNNMGDIQIDPKVENIVFTKLFEDIQEYILNAQEELELKPTDGSFYLNKGKTSYYKVKVVVPDTTVNWELSFINSENLPKDKVTYYENLIKLDKVGHDTLALRPGKANSLIGKQFKLTAHDPDGICSSQIVVEVSE